MKTTNLKRKQIYIDEDSDRALKTLAITTKISESAHIRRAVKKYIAKQKKNITSDDPLQKLVGLCDNPEGSTDASIHHDKYLYRFHQFCNRSPSGCQRSLWLR
ncbi:MAG: CopG family transcriptional regulator [Deltaproteobacteria bacterium]|nr:CopG family transcriptional regulator [Deltaproteobacteria bacterium]